MSRISCECALNDMIKLVIVLALSQTPKDQCSPHTSDEIVGYISTIYFCDKAKGTTYRSKYKQ